MNTHIDIREHPEIIEIINAVLNNKGIAEVKNESRNNEKLNLVVVEVNRTVKTKRKEK